MKTKRRPGVSDAGKERLNVHISAESYQRLQIHCVMSGTTPGRLVERLVNDHCREWKVQSNATSRPASSRPVPDMEGIGEMMPVA